MTPALATYTLPVLGTALPEIVLALGALALVLWGAIKGDAALAVIERLALALLLAVAALVLVQPSASVTTFEGSFVVDGFARFMKIVALLASAAALSLSFDDMRRSGDARYEYSILVVLSTLGMLMMISANDLIALYLGLELSSLALYVMAAIRRDDAKASEAGLKYFVLGALSSGMLLYGASLVYGFTGTVSFPGIAAAVKGQGSTGVIFGLVFILAGLAFKVSAVPFHMWTPDVYEGAPTPVTAFFSAAPKVAAMALFVRVAVDAFPNITDQWRQITVFIAIGSMLLGAFAAIGQRNLKRLMAYSSIGHMGYALVGLSAGGEQGVNGVLIYMAIYAAMTLGVFACIVAMRTATTQLETIDDLSGLATSKPAMAFLLAMLMFSLAGIPPLAGFFAKFYVIAAAVEAKLVPLAVIAMLSSVVGAYYYLRIVKIIYFDAPRAAFEPMAVAPKIVLGVSSVIVLGFWLFPGPLVAAAAAAARSLF